MTATHTAAALLRIALSQRAIDIAAQLPVGEVGEYIADLLDQCGYVIVPKAKPYTAAAAETAEVLAHALTQASKARVNLADVTPMSRNLGSTPVAELMPDVVQQLVQRPDLLRALLANQPALVPAEASSWLAKALADPDAANGAITDRSAAAVFQLVRRYDATGRSGWEDHPDRDDEPAAVALQPAGGAL